MTSSYDIIGRARDGESFDDLFICDAHGHLGPYWNFSIWEPGAETLIEVMDRVGIDVACVSGHAAACGGEYRAGNDLVIEAVRRHPDRILGYGVAFPHAKEGVGAELERCLQAGLCGIKIHSCHDLPYTDAAYRPVYELARQHELPVLAHTWDKELAWIEDLASEYPRVNFLLAHTGAVDLNGYVEAAWGRDNVYLELCSSASAYGLVERIADRVGCERVVWGSDAVFLASAQQIGRVLFADISDRAKEAILGGNARHLFGIQTTKGRS